MACCRRIWHLLADQRSRAAVETAAHYAEGLVNCEQLVTAAEVARAAHEDAFRVKGKRGASAEWAAQFAVSPDAWFAASRASNFAYVAAGDPVLEPGPEKAAQADLLRCMLGPLPFRPIAFDPAWLRWYGGSVARLAKLIYDEGKFEWLPILADALEEAGCQSAELLAHLRGPGPHARGCFVLDLVLHLE